jgi:hypothetical protein
VVDHPLVAVRGGGLEAVLSHRHELLGQVAVEVTCPAVIVVSAAVIASSRAQMASASTRL